MIMMRHENPSVLNHGTMEKCELGSILSDYLQVCLGLGWSANWSPDHEPSCDSTYLLASVTWRKSHQENGMPKNKPRHQWSIKASHCHFPRRGGPEAGSNWASQSHRQKITPVTLRWAYLSSPGELSPSPWSPWGNKEYIWSLFPTRTGWAASLTAPWEAEALSMTLPQNLSQPPITRVFYRMRQVLPESTPVTMQTPRLHPKPTMWWSYFVVQAGFKHISSCFSLWNSKVTGAYYHGNCIYTKYLKLGALPLVHLLHTVVWELFPGPVSMAIPNVFFLRDLTTLGLEFARKRIPSISVSYLWFQALPRLIARKEPLGMIILKSVNQESSQAPWWKINFKPGSQAISELFLGWAWSRCKWPYSGSTGEQDTQYSQIIKPLLTLLS